MSNDSNDERPPKPDNVVTMKPRPRLGPPTPSPADKQLTENVNEARANGHGRGGGAGGMLTRAQRRTRVLELAASGLRESDIAAQLGMSQQGVSAIIRRELEKLTAYTAEKAEELRTLDLVRLDQAMRAIAGRVLKGELAAIDRWIKLIAQRQKLLGAQVGPEATGDTYNFFNFDPERVKDLEKLTFDYESTAVEVNPNAELVADVESQHGQEG